MIYGNNAIYEATIITKENSRQFPCRSEEILLLNVLREIRKIDEESIMLSTRFREKHETGKQCYIPCYPCELIFERFKKDELIEILEEYLNEVGYAKEVKEGK